MGLLAFIAINAMLLAALYAAVRKPGSLLAFAKEVVSKPLASLVLFAFIGSCLVAGWGIVSGGRLSWLITTPWGKVQSWILAGLVAIGFVIAFFAYSVYENDFKRKKHGRSRNVASPGEDVVRGHACAMTTRASTSCELVARLLSSRSTWAADYRDLLVAGVAVERDRLGTRPYVLVLNEQEFDYEGLSESVCLLESHLSRVEAEDSAPGHVRQRVATLMAVDPSSSRRWHMESEERSPYLLEPKIPTEARTVAQCSAKLRASAYDIVYLTVRVVGPFSNGPVDGELVDFLGATWALQRHFIEAGKRVQAQ